MKVPKKPKNEETRIKALHTLEVLDTASEERFDRLTRLAAHIFNVPISLVSFVDVNRQWFKSCIGLDVLETEREISFCAHAILSNDLFIVEDTLLDPRFVDNPLVSGPPHIRFYVGRVLKSACGEQLGTLCIIDDKPHSCVFEDFVALEDLAAMAEDELAAVKSSSVDELTDISNRRGFMALAKTSLEFYNRHHLTASIIAIDLNNFKQINDQFGHAEGDLAIQTFANVLKKSFRESDVIARLGGDEFVVLLAAPKEGSITDIIERLRDELATINKAEHRGYNIEFACGIVSIQNKNQSIESYLEQADKLMYQNKCDQKSKQN